MWWPRETPRPSTIPASLWRYRWSTRSARVSQPGARRVVRAHPVSPNDCSIIGTTREEFEGRRFFFCQLEAVETLIWLLESPAADRVGIEIASDGGEFARQCCKMATGSGKTIVMAMVIAWHVLNRVATPQDARFAKNVLVVAPGLTVKNRLAVLEPSADDNYYEGVQHRTCGHA